MGTSEHFPCILEAARHAYKGTAPLALAYGKIITLREWHISSYMHIGFTSTCTRLHMEVLAYRGAALLPELVLRLGFATVELPLFFSHVLHYSEKCDADKQLFAGTMKVVAYCTYSGMVDCNCNGLLLLLLYN